MRQETIVVNHDTIVLKGQLYYEEGEYKLQRKKGGVTYPTIRVIVKRDQLPAVLKDGPYPCVVYGFLVDAYTILARQIEVKYG